MTGANFAALIRKYTGTNVATLPDSDIVLLANTAKDSFASQIVKANEDVFGVPATRDLENDTREYSLPEDIIRIKSVEAKLNGTDQVNMSELDLNTYKRTTDETTITNTFSNEQDHAFYDVFRNSLWLYCGALTGFTANNGFLKLWYIAWPADISAATLALLTDLSIDPTETSAQLPRQFHELWARQVSIDFKNSKDKPIPLNEKELAFKYDFSETMSSLSGLNLDRSLTATLPSDKHLQGY